MKELWPILILTKFLGNYILLTPVFFGSEDGKASVEAGQDTHNDGASPRGLAVPKQTCNTLMNRTVLQLILVINTDLFTITLGYGMYCDSLSGGQLSLLEILESYSAWVLPCSHSLGCHCYPSCLVLQSLSIFFVTVVLSAVKECERCLLGRLCSKRLVAVLLFQVRACIFFLLSGVALVKFETTVLFICMFPLSLWRLFLA